MIVVIVPHEIIFVCYGLLKIVIHTRFPIGVCTESVRLRIVQLLGKLYAICHKHLGFASKWLRASAETAMKVWRLINKKL